MTNWMGDEGWLKTCYARYTKFVYLSDVLWLHGKVTKKYIDEPGEHCLEIETSTINQRQEEVMPGHSTVVLPSREKNTWPVAARL
jgi:acyl dehydratase